MNWQMALYKIT